MALTGPYEAAPRWQSQPDSAQVRSGIIGWRLAAVSSVSLTSFAASYFFILERAWWTDQGSDFRFTDDSEYALNLDKAGHFFGGFVAAEAFYDALKWSGLTEGKAHVTSALLSSVVQLGIDFKDAYSPEWGYSAWDVGAGVFGAFLPMARRYMPGMQALDFKWSYWRTSDSYFETSDTDFWGDDYVNQTYWLSWKTERALPEGLRAFWPGFLALAAGLSIDDGIYSQGFQNGRREVYLSLDWDVEALNPFGRHPGWTRFFRYLNFFKFPSPTWQVYPARKFLWAYPLAF